MRVLCLLSLCLLLTSCGFDHLTDIHNDDVEAPNAAECVSCHVEQYSELESKTFGHLLNLLPLLTPQVLANK